MNKYFDMSVTRVIHDETNNHSRSITANTLTTKRMSADTTISNTIKRYQNISS